MPKLGVTQISNLAASYYTESFKPEVIIYMLFLTHFQGTALNTEQLNAVITLLPELESVLKSKGFKDIARPDYANASKKSVDDEDDEEEEEAVESGADEGEEVEAPSKKSKNKLDKFKHKTKKNHEASSDEDDD